MLKEKIDHMQKADKHGRHPKYKHLVYFELEPHHGSYILTAPDTVRRKDALLSYDDAKSMLGKDFVDREFGYASDEYLDLLEQKTETTVQNLKKKLKQGVDIYDKEMRPLTAAKLDHINMKKVNVKYNRDMKYYQITEQKLSKLQLAYREFFMAKMEEFGVKSPTQLKSTEEKKKFWNSVKKEWPTAKKQIQEGVVRKEIRKAIAEVLEDMISDEKGDEATEQDFDPREIEIGIEVEMEHTDDPAKAKEITFDHLIENPKYYSDLMAYGMVNEPGAIKAAKRLGKKVGQTHSPTTHKGSATASKPVSRAYEGALKEKGN